MGKFVDLTGQRFGRWTVIRRAKNHIQPDGRKRIKWLCKCDCGELGEVGRNSLIKKESQSCGCLNRENGLNRVKQMKYFDGTQIESISSKRRLNKNNKTGHKGVDFHQGKYRVRINLKGIERYLGSYDKLEDAIKARKLAEEKLFNPIIEEYEKESANVKKD